MSKIIIRISYTLIFILLLLGLNTILKTPEKGGVEDSDLVPIVILDTTLIFQAGFEYDSRIIEQNAKDAKIVGADLSLKHLNDWAEDLENHPRIGYANIQYQGGEPEQRLAEIVHDPKHTGNQTLKFWLKAPNVDAGAGRVQMNVYGNNTISKMVYSCRLLLPEDFSRLGSADFKVDWLTLMEFWNNANWTAEKFPFRMTVNLVKSKNSNQPFRIGITAQVYDTERRKWKDQPVWDYLNTSFEIPINRWMTWEILFIEGNTHTGKLRLSITPEGGKKTVVHEISNITHHPNDPYPDGLDHFNPMKLYTSSKVINHMAHNGNYLQVYWDDFKLFLIP